MASLDIHLCARQRSCLCYRKRHYQKKHLEKESEENYKKFKGLATHFKNNLEKDRKHFAVELHEELAQLAAAIKLDIYAVKNGTLHTSGDLNSRMENASAVCELLIGKIREMSFTFSPNTLEYLGLDDTLHSLCRNFKDVHNIACTFKSSYNEDDLNHEIKLDFFRICQESLSNILRHSGARAVEIEINDNDDEICLSVLDNGIGFEVDQQQHMPGLINMRELAASVNGHLHIESEPGGGTKVCFIIQSATKSLSYST